MRILIIRHGDPDYVHDSLTEKGWREAELLKNRLIREPMSAIYCSPLGRAQVGPGEGAVAVVQYVHIEQPPQGVLILHGDGLSFYRGGIGVQDQ